MSISIDDEVDSAVVHAVAKARQQLVAITRVRDSLDQHGYVPGVDMRTARRLTKLSMRQLASLPAWKTLKFCRVTDRYVVVSALRVWMAACMFGPHQWLMGTFKDPLVERLLAFYESSRPWRLEGMRVVDVPMPRWRVRLGEWAYKLSWKLQWWA